MKKNRFNSVELGKLLKKVYLGGLINECVLEVSEEKASIHAIDMSDSIYVFVAAKIGGLPDMKVGLSNLSYLCAFLEREQKALFKIDEKWITFTCKKNRFKVLHIKPEQITTAISDTEDADKSKLINKILKKCPNKVELTAKSIDSFLYYVSLIKPKSIQLVSSNNKTSFQSALTTPEAQFSVFLDNNTAEDVVVELFTDRLVAIFKELDWKSKDSPTLVYGEEPEIPIAIKQDNAIWTVTPLQAE